MVLLIGYFSLFVRQVLFIICSANGSHSDSQQFAAKKAVTRGVLKTQRPAF